MVRSRRSGFTLIEIMIVVGIIGLLVAVLLTVLLSASDKGDVGKARNFCNTLVPSAIEKWQEDNGQDRHSYPATPKMAPGVDAEGNKILYEEFVTRPDKSGKGAYITADNFTEGMIDGKKVFLDPWNNPYIYRNHAQRRTKSGSTKPFPENLKKNPGSYDIISMGPDGLPDTEDDIWNGSP
jgi:general secretion pathway protein G